MFWERAMKTLIGVTLLGLMLFLLSPVRRIHAQSPPPSTAHTKLAPRLSEAPTGFDNKSNSVVDDQTHGLDQANFEHFEAISDGLGPLFNAQSCRECHQSPVTGGASQVTELRVGHKGPGGNFQNPEIPINHGSEVIKGRSLVEPASNLPQCRLSGRRNSGARARFGNDSYLFAPHWVFSAMDLSRQLTIRR